MKVKIIPIMLLLLFSMATPVVVSMAIPEDAKPFHIVAVLDPYEDLLDKKGVQKYTQEGDLYDADDYELNGDEADELGTIVLHIIITNFDKASTGKYARARVHFIMQIDGRTVNGIIVGKILIDDEGQHADGIFVGRGSHVKGKISYIDPENPDVLLFDGMEW